MLKEKRRTALIVDSQSATLEDINSLMMGVHDPLVGIIWSSESSLQQYIHSLCVVDSLESGSQN